jgi:hypothetical protein
MLKWVAVVSMTIDHIGVVLYPEYTLLRMVGRLAFPLYGYLIVMGMKSTKDAWRYFTRLFVFAFPSQVPYYLALEGSPFTSLNIFFTLAFGVLALIFYERHSLLVLVPIIASIVLNVDYGLYGLALIGCLYILDQHTAYGVAATLVLNTLFLPVWMVQFCSLLALPLILLHHRSNTRHRSEATSRYAYPLWRRYFFYVYYPLHLSLLYLFRVSSS